MPAMGMNIIAYDPHVPIHQNNKAVSSDEVLNNSDIILLAVHLDESTENLVDSSWFNKMKDGSVFVNISRREIVDELALMKL